MTDSFFSPVQSAGNLLGSDSLSSISELTYFVFFTFLLIPSGAADFLSRFSSRRFRLFAWRRLCLMRLRRARLMCDS